MPLPDFYLAAMEKMVESVSTNLARDVAMIPGLLSHLEKDVMSIKFS